MGRVVANGIYLYRIRNVGLNEISVTGGRNSGGLVGQNCGGAINASYAAALVESGGPSGSAGGRDASLVSEAHLVAFTHLQLASRDITALKPGDFSGLTALTSLNLDYNQLRSLPDSVFEGLSNLIVLDLSGNAISPLPVPVSLEKVDASQVKATAPLILLTSTNSSTRSVHE